MEKVISLAVLTVAQARERIKAVLNRNIPMTPAQSVVLAPLGWQDDVLWVALGTVYTHRVTPFRGGGCDVWISVTRRAHYKGVAVTIRTDPAEKGFEQEVAAVARAIAEPMSADRLPIPRDMQDRREKVARLFESESGLTDREMAEQLVVSISTIKADRKALALRKYKYRKK